MGHRSPIGVEDGHQKSPGLPSARFWDRISCHGKGVRTGLIDTETAIIPPRTAIIRSGTPDWPATEGVSQVSVGSRCWHGSRRGSGSSTIESLRTISPLKARAETPSTYGRAHPGPGPGGVAGRGAFAFQAPTLLGGGGLPGRSGRRAGRAAVGGTGGLRGADRLTGGFPMGWRGSEVPVDGRFQPSDLKSSSFLVATSFKERSAVRTGGRGSVLPGRVIGPSSVEPSPGRSRGVTPDSTGDRDG